MRKVVSVYVYNLIYALDVLVNVILGGDRRDTISSRLGKGQRAGKPVHSVLARGVDWFFWMVFDESRHCESSIANIDDCYALSSIWGRK